MTMKASAAEWKWLEIFLPLLLLTESLIQFYGKPLFHLSYIIFIIVIAGFFPLKLVLSSILAILLLGVPTQMFRPVWFETDFLSWFYLLVFFTGIVSYFIFYRETKKSKKAVKDLEKLKRSALNLEASTESSLFDEDRFSHLVKSVLETQHDLSAILHLTKKVTRADSAVIFVPEGNTLMPKASTEDATPELTDGEKDFLAGIIKGRKPVIQSKLKGGYSGRSLHSLHTKRAKAFLGVPVLDGSIPLGVLLLYSNREAAFGENDVDIASEFALQVKQILKRARTYIEVERFTKGFKALHEASSTLSSHLEVEKIAEGFVDLVSGMVSSSAVGFFIADKGKLRVIAKRGFEPEKDSFYTKGTYFNLIIKNKHPFHFSQLDKKKEVYPFKAADTRTFLGIPIIPEKEVLGVLAVTSQEPDAISSFQVHLMTTIADQAAMYIINAQLHKQVEKLAVTDGLTDLYNHKHFQEKLNEEFQRMKRIPQKFSLMLIDIDHFKKINDTYGHPAGDMVLKNLAITLKKTLRGIDIIARYGGEEFAAVLMGSERSGAKKMAERLRTTVMNSHFLADEHKLSITLSIGISTYPDDSETKDELISKADQALYFAKENGRNQVCAWKDVAKKITQIKNP
jgi:diguanylate cyclase (GGDEF)-like protein